jgi:hypothetical protein
MRDPAHSFAFDDEDDDDDDTLALKCASAEFERRVTADYEAEKRTEADRVDPYGYLR